MEINPEYSLGGLMLKLKLQYYECLMAKAGLLERTLMLGKIEGKSSRGRQRVKGETGPLVQWTWVSAHSGNQRRTEPGVPPSMWSQRAGHDLASEQQQQSTYKHVRPFLFCSSHRKIIKQFNSVLSIFWEWLNTGSGFILTCLETMYMPKFTVADAESLRTSTSESKSLNRFNVHQIQVSLVNNFPYDY